MNRTDRGAALVEFALVVPLLLVVIAGIVDFGFAFQRYEVVTNAAREGARLATLPGYNDQAAVDARVRAYVMEGLSISAGQLGASMPSGAVTLTNADLTIAGQPVPTAIVTVNYNHTFLMLGPMLGLINKSWDGSITLTAKSQMRIES
jgi:Flp pilus assembly protein TadG